MALIHAPDLLNDYSMLGTEFGGRDLKLNRKKTDTISASMDCHPLGDINNNDMF